ncbi:MAG: response regulator transcription factor [Chitinophagaceae bacterium]|jgi:DNA-binding NarL/FixJ family response regulator|nr:response regulator transcription factor [Chitinophagaceae bacterium]MBK7680072.1 response regulator transcription factor [Chitinophagaceae bacterium]MBK9465563.1 response regulator transcription factor [Chitinophagaceae bacterium]MBK9660703.1 response regulator transcription factor [Chitinophagaceae bacterium]MBK9937780.1 response regulator transcription factor [Chitinophagaceae bacterium]
MLVNIAIVDDKASNRSIIKDKLLRHKIFEVSLIAENGKDFLDKMKVLPPDKVPSVVLMDLEMPEMDGVDAVAAGSYLYPTVKFVMLTIFDDEEKIFKAIKAGAFGYLLKDESAENIAETLEQMHENGVGPISPGIAHKILQLVQNNTVSLIQKHIPEKDKTPFNLTEREQEILKLLVQGLQYKEIGSRLQISPNTAKKHVLNIYSKLHVNSKTQALALAYEKGLI